MQAAGHELEAAGLEYAPDLECSGSAVPGDRLDGLSLNQVGNSGKNEKPR